MRREAKNACFVVVLTTLVALSFFTMPSGEFSLRSSSIRTDNPLSAWLSSNEGVASNKPAASTGYVFSGHAVRTFSGATRLQHDAVAAAPQSSLPLHPRSKLCEKWGVVTTINAPTESILTFAALKDWCLVIVADSITPQEGYLSLAGDSDGRIVFLSVKDQQEMALHSHFVKMIPYQSFARKNIGFLFAIRHGAQAIFDFDDDNVLKEAAFSSSPRSPLVLLPESDDPNKREDHVWVVRTPSASTDGTAALSLNPLPFMKPSVAEIWPRGFPLQDVRSASSFPGISATSTLQSIPRSKIGVVQATCDQDPDVDAIYRLTRTLPVTFDETPATALRLVVPSGRYAPYNAQATTHMYDAFWGLLLPYTVPGRVTDIWRAYFTQRILHDLGLALVYSPPLVVHNRSVHNYIADLEAEQDLYLKTEALLGFLSKWTDTSHSLPARVENLAISLYERDYIGLEDVLAMQDWLLALMDAGYRFPSLSGGQTLSHVMKPVPVLREQGYVVPPKYNLGGKKGDWKLYSEFINWNESATVSEWNEWLEGSKMYREANSALVPPGIALALVVMVKNEWPIIRSNILYHGHLLGFKNLYIVDGSTDPQSTSFLVLARDQLGVNVIFSPADLQNVGKELSAIGRQLAGSSDLVAKMDADEFLSVVTNGTGCHTSPSRPPQDCTLSPYAMKLFLQNRSNIEHFSGLGKTRTSVSWMVSLADKEICDLGLSDDVTQYKFKVHEDTWGKSITDSRILNYFDLGGHYNRLLGPHGKTNVTFYTPVGNIHNHFRCFEIEVINCFKVLESHEFVAASDSREEAKQKLKKYMGEDEAGWCEVKESCTNMVQRSPSCHKVVFYAKYLAGCPGSTAETFYAKNYFSTQTQGFYRASNPDFNAFMKEALSLYG